MTFPSGKNMADQPGFVFIGDHPAVDFANTVVIYEGQLTDLLADWTDVIHWLSQAGLSTNAPLQIPASRSRNAVERVADLRRGWKTELDKLTAGGKVSDAFIEMINGILMNDGSHGILQRTGKTLFRLERSASKLVGEKLALVLLARQIAIFLAEANLTHLHRCANTTSCVLYFYDTTKNHRRQWCSVSTCGNRHKVAQFRKRRAKAA
jgi:predicted RNA-binding Zn ribbon-like protein